MEIQDDSSLLARYAIDDDQDAFRALTVRYGSLVYGACKRRIGRSDLAEDATQVVFLILARKARRLTNRRALGPWLYTCSVNVSKSILRTEARRMRHEREALEARFDDDEAAFDLESALSGLRGKDRDAIVLRYLQGQSLAEVAGVLGISEDAARMRVNRALAKLKRDLGPKTAALESLAAVAVPSKLVGTPSEFLRALPNRYTRLIGGHSLMTSTPALSLLSVFVVLGGTAATLKLHSPKPDPNKPVASLSIPLPSVLQGIQSAPSKDFLKDILLEILGTWHATLGSEDGGKTTNMSFPGTVIRAGKAKGDLVLHSEQPSPTIGSMDAAWTVDADRGILYFLTDEGPKGTPLRLTSTSVNQKKAKVAVFEGKSAKASYKLTLTFSHDRFDFVVTGQNVDGSKLTPEEARITLERQPKS